MKLFFNIRLRSHYAVITLTAQLLLFIISIVFPLNSVHAQDPFSEDSFNELSQFDENGNITNNASQRKSGTWGRDTSKVDKSVPTEFHQWRIDDSFGNIIPEQYNDTLPHAFQNFNATEGLYGGYNILGNLGSPRYAINFLDRPLMDDLMFIQPFDYFHTTPANLLFTNTKSPLTNLQYHKSGTKQNGQDRFRAYFATNINKQTGIGFKIDYLYGRGYYNNQANSQFGGTIFGYYHGERYEMHAMGSWEHMKMQENGGITDDTYINDPESFRRKVRSRDIPTVFSNLFNQNDHNNYFLTHRYNLGKYRLIDVPDSLKPQMPDDDQLFTRIKSDSLKEVIKEDSLRYLATIDSLRNQWTSEQVPPREFIPITSLIHTFNMRQLFHTLHNNSSISSTYFSHDPYYRSSYSNFKDKTDGLSVKNTLGIQLREGFNKWAKAGITLFARHEYQHFTLPDSVETTDSTSGWEHYKSHDLSIGGEIFKTQGHTVHYHAGAELFVAGPKIGDLSVYGNADLNFKLGKDTVRFEANASFKNLSAPFYFTHFHSQTTWWDKSPNQETRTRLEGKLTLDRTHTSLRFGMENISNYTHLAMQLTPMSGGTTSSYARDVILSQRSGSIQILSATVQQDLHLGFFHWVNSITWQKSSDENVIPLPTLYIYTNPYLKITLAKVLTVEVGADMRFHTKYYGLDYEPFINQFAIQDYNQERIKIGGFPIMHAYANFAIKRVRGYIQYTRFAGGSQNAFWAPHYPIDPSGLHFGISWNFYD